MVENKVGMPSKTTIAHQASAQKSLDVGKNIAPAGAVAGVASGAIVGSALGWLLGMYMLPVSNIGDFMWTVPTSAIITGFGVGGMIGGTIGALIGMFISDNGNSRYEGGREGWLLSDSNRRQ